MGMIREFRDFAIKGNLVDIAVAFVLGGAFGKVITSFTEGIISPLVGLITGTDLSKNMYVIKPAVYDAAGKVIKEAVALKWGDFITAIINFLIVAFTLFLIVKAMNKLKKQEAAAITPPTQTEVLLMEIRDSLKGQR
jgi:large conductance mechanosensitive channel